eukprot:COSAG02_NODE_59149_length_275_cov_0.585227_1_plen_65_part_10
MKAVFRRVDICSVVSHLESSRGCQIIDVLRHGSCSVHLECLGEGLVLDAKFGQLGRLLMQMRLLR